MDNFIIKDLTLETIDDFKKCFDKNGNSKDINHLKWQFLDNPERNDFPWEFVEATQTNNQSCYNSNNSAVTTCQTVSDHSDNSNTDSSNILRLPFSPVGNLQMHIVKKKSNRGISVNQCS